MTPHHGLYQLLQYCSDRRHCDTIWNSFSVRTTLVKNEARTRRSEPVEDFLSPSIVNSRTVSLGKGRHEETYRCVTVFVSRINLEDDKS